MIHALIADSHGRQATRSFIDMEAPTPGRSGSPCRTTEMTFEEWVAGEELYVGENMGCVERSKFLDAWNEAYKAGYNAGYDAGAHGESDVKTHP